MFQIDVSKFIPKALTQEALDVTVNFLVDLGKGYLNDEILRRIKQLRSDGAFQNAFEDGLQRATDRFIIEYFDEDEDLVEAIVKEKAFFENKEVQSALLSVLQQPGTYLVKEQDILIQSFDSILPNRRNRERVNRAMIYFLKCLAEEVWHLPELHPVYELQFQRITADAVREQVDIQKAYLQTNIALSADIREALLQLTDAIAEQKLLPNSESALLSRSKPLHNLPQPDYERFIGRKMELKQIGQLLLPYPKSRHFVITIDGIGGIGKSALALEVADSYRRHFDKLVEGERFEAIIWTTAKQTVLTGEGITTRSQSLRTLEDIYKAIASTLDREDIPRSSVDEQDNLIRQALTQQQTLLIIDNLETVDDERVMNFIREVPAPTKVIVTTRHRVDVAYPIRLTGMPKSDALQLISDEANKKSVTLNSEDAEHLFQRTGGVPLAIVWSIAQMGFGHNVKSVLQRLGNPASDIAKFCFDGAVEHIRNKPAYKLLKAMSLSSVGVRRETLGYITNLPVLDRDDGLVQLEKLSLVNREIGWLFLSPLTQVYSTSELAKNPELEKLFRDRWVEFYSKFLIEQRRKKYTSLEIVKLEIDNILAVLDWCWHDNRLDIYLTLAQNMDFYLWVTGNWNTWGRYMELALQAAISLEDELAQANLYRLLAAMGDFQGTVGSIELTEAKRYINKAILIYKSYNEQSELAISIWRLGSIQIKNGEKDLARKSLTKALEIAQQLNDERHIARVQRRLAVIDIKDGNYELAETRLNQAKTLRERHFGEDEPILSMGLAYTYRLLGDVSFFKQDYEIAREYYEQSLDMGQRINSPQDIASTKQSLARLELALGKTEKAATLAQEVLVMFTKLNIKEGLVETQKLLQQVGANN